MNLIQRTSQHRGRAVAAMVVVATLSACVADQPTAPSTTLPTTASAVIGAPKPNCWPKCPASGGILYVKGDTTLKIGRIWVKTTSSEAQLTFGNGDDDQPTWSPDYQKVAFISKRRGNWEIFSMNADGSGQTPLTTSMAGSWDDHPSWSPDGTRIYFAHITPDPVSLTYHSEVYSVKPNGTGVTKVSNSPNANLYDPSVSPDGKKILVTRMTTNNVTSGHLFTINTSGGSLTPITNTTLGEGMGAWSPDGRKIAFIINNGAPDYRELATVNADGTALTVILERVGSQEHPSWAPDGGRIVFVDFGVNKWGWLFTVKPDGTGLTQLEDPLDVGSYYSPMWSR